MSTTNAYTDDWQRYHPTKSMDAIGHYIDPSDAICASCWETEPEWSGFDGWENPIAIFWDTEADSPTHCARCDALIPHKLTSDGLAYVLGTIHDAVTDRLALAACIARGKPRGFRNHDIAWIWAREWFPTILAEHTSHLLSAPESEILAVTCIDCRTLWTVDH